MLGFDGKVAVVTGGARGIGRGLARLLLARGASVAIADIDEASLAEAAADLCAGNQLSTHVVDVRRSEELERLREETLSHHGGAHALFNNAGLTMYGLLEQFTDDEIRRIVDVNLMGVIHGCRAFTPHFRAQKEGALINMSSMAAISGMPRQSTYCATKAAVRALSQSLAVELADVGISVTWMVAGPIGTGIVSRAASHDAAMTRKLGSILERYAMRPERAAEKVIRKAERGGGEVRITASCEAYYQLNRVSPGLTRGSMRLAAGGLSRGGGTSK